MVDEIPIEKLYSQPIVQELLSKLKDNQQLQLQSAGGNPVVDLENIKIPYVIENKVLMSPGVWNDYYYSAEAIKDAYLKSRWDSKDVRSLFLDHLDGTSGKAGASTWVGEVSNPRMEGDSLVGDLVFVDKGIAQKLAYGARMGISPKVHGMEDANEMMSFEYDNFSVVIRPAVKTAYINNSQKEPSQVNPDDKKNKPEDEEEDMACKKKKLEEDLAAKPEAPKEPYGDVKYADPGYRDDQKRYPIDSEAHVRAAWSYINQSKNAAEYTAEQLELIKGRIIAAAKEFGIKISKNNEEETKMADNTEEVKKLADVEPEAVAEVVAEPVAEAEAAPAVEVEAEPVAVPEMENAESAPKEMASMDIVDQIFKLAEMLKSRLSAQVEPAETMAAIPEKVVPVEKVENNEKINEMQSTIKELSERLQSVTAKLNEPDKRAIKTAELTSAQTQESIVRGNLDGAMLAAFRQMGGN